MELEGAAAHGAAAAARDEQQARGRREVVDRRRDAAAPDRTRSRSAAQARRSTARCTSARRRVAGSSLSITISDATAAARPPAWTSRAERRRCSSSGVEHGLGQLVRHAIELRSLGRARGGQPSTSDAPVARGGLDRDEALGLERAQQPARVARSPARAGVAARARRCRRARSPRACATRRVAGRVRDTARRALPRARSRCG